jgi:predicted ATP-dependent serine protease
LLNTDEQTAQRREKAKEDARVRLEQAKLRASGSNSGDKQRLAELKALQSSKTTQLRTAFGSDKRRLQSELAVIEAEIAQMAGVGTMAAAPGASSPGGTKPGWGKASTV